MKPRRTVPWEWVARFVTACLAVFLVNLAYPHMPWWEVMLWSTAAAMGVGMLIRSYRRAAAAEAERRRQ